MKHRWVFIPYHINDKDIRIYLLLDDKHFGENANIEIILNATYEKLRIKQIRRGYIC